MDPYCALCDVSMPPLSIAIDEGWIPSYWIQDEEQPGPVCSMCADHRYLTIGLDGEWEWIEKGKCRESYQGV